MPSIVSPETFVHALLQGVALIFFQRLFWLMCQWLKTPITREFSLLLAIYLGGPALLYFLSRDPFAFLLVLSFGCVYVMTFGCASVRSPSFEILLILRKNPGMSLSEIETQLAKEDLLNDRVQDLGEEGLLAGKKLRGTGKAVGCFFHTFRCVLRQPLGSG